MNNMSTFGPFPLPTNSQIDEWLKSEEVNFRKCMHDQIMKAYGIPSHLAGGPDLRFEFEKMVEACYANPQDDSLRGMLADWMEERGDGRAADVRKTVGRRPYRLRNYWWSEYTLHSLHNGQVDLSELPKPLMTAMVSFIPEDCSGDMGTDTWMRASCGIDVETANPWSLFARSFRLWLLWKE